MGPVNLNGAADAGQPVRPADEWRMPVNSPGRARRANFGAADHRIIMASAGPGYFGSARACQ